MVAGPGGDLLSHVLRRSTMGASGFHGRVRHGIGWGTRAIGHQVDEPSPAVSIQRSARKICWRLIAASGKLAWVHRWPDG